MAAKSRQKNAPQAPLTPQKAFQIALKTMRAGQLREAYVMCRKILAADPLFTDALHLQGVIEMSAGDIGKALETLQKVRTLRPGDASVWSDLGMIYQGLRQHEEARAHLQQAIELDPRNAGAHLNLGNVFSALGELDAAERHYKAAIKRDPKMTAGFNNLSRTLLIQGRAREGENRARQAIALEPKNALAHSHLAEALDRLGEQQQSLKAHQRAVALAPDRDTIRLAYIATLAAYGRLDEARAQCEKILEEHPQSVDALMQLSRLERFTEEDALFEKLQTAFANEQLPALERAKLGFSLGKAEEDMKRYKAAFGRFLEANALIAEGLPYSPSQTEQQFAQIIEDTTPQLMADLAEAGHPDPTPIFVVGMPRSGTTLIEQILASHPDVAGAGELSSIRTLQDALLRANPGKSMGEALRQTPPEKLRGLGAAYIEQVRMLSRDARYIVDKMPANFMSVGFIRAILPNATIIHARRNATDTCLSIFKNQFVMGSMPYAYKLEWLGHYYHQYDNLMRHWAELLADDMLELDYEELIADQEKGSRALLAHCGLDWRDDVLDFHKADRPVHTASIAQVRQPIYKTSVGIAERYGDAVTPLLDALKAQRLATGKLG